MFIQKLCNLVIQNTRDISLMAVDASLITQEFLDAERERLGPLCLMYYECDFYNPSSSYKPEYFVYADNEGGYEIQGILEKC